MWLFPEKKIPAKKFSAYVDSIFNNFPIIFWTKISKLFAKAFQQKFSRESLMQFWTQLSDVFWKYGTFFLLQSRSSRTKFWVSKTKDMISQNKALESRFSSEKPTAELSRNVKLTWKIFPIITLSKFSSGHFECCFDKPAEKLYRRSKFFQLNSRKITFLSEVF